MKFLSNFSTKESKLHIVYLIFHLAILLLTENFGYYNIIFIGALGLLTIGYMAYDMLHKKTILDSKYIWLLVAFVISNCISIAVNIKYGVFDNLISMLCLFINYFVLYNFNGQNITDVKQSIRIVTNFCIILFTFGALMGFASYCCSFARLAIFNDKTVRRGFVGSRLYGIWTDPNYACTRCIVLILFCVYNIMQTKDKLLRVLYCFAISLLYIFFVLSGSRTGVLASYCAIIVGSVVLANRMYKHKVFFMRQFIAGACAIVLCISLYGSMELTKKCMSYMPSITAKYIDFDDDNEEEAISQVNLIRADVAGNDDISNNRFQIWGSAVEIIKTAPVIGASQRNYIAYAQDVLPETYMSIKGYEPHNAFLELFLSCGFIGGGIMIAFLGLCATTVLKHLFTCDDDAFLEVFIFTLAILMILVSGMTLNGLFFNRTSYNTLFWISLGYVMYFCKKYNENKTE